MKIGRQDEWYLLDPVHDCFGLRLSLLFVPGFKVIREIAIQVESAGIVSAPRSLTLAFDRFLESIRIHGGHDVDARVVQQISDVWVSGVIGEQVVGEMEQQLATHSLVSMHVRHVLDVRLQQDFRFWTFADKENPQVASCNNSTS